MFANGAPNPLIDQDRGAAEPAAAASRYGRRNVLLAGAIAAALGVGRSAIAEAGTGHSTPTTGTPPGTPPVETSAVGTPVASDPEFPSAPTPLPDSPVGRQTAWILDQIRAVAGGVPVDQDGLAARLHPTLLEALPLEDWAGSFGQVAALLGPDVLPVGLQGTPADQFITLVFVGTDGDPYAMTVQVDVSDAALVLALGIKPFDVPTDTFGDWSELTLAAEAIPSSVAIFVGEVDGDTIVPIHSLDDARPLAIGSAFKLYVLGTGAQQVLDGAFAWDDIATISDADRSFPSGVMQLLPTGTGVSVRALADHMIAISDNTATDHLIGLIGRETVEAGQSQFGLNQPERNIPFVTTRELFTLRVAVDPSVTEEYATATVERRREILADLDQVTVNPDAFTSWTTPLQIDLVEWYASVAELAQAIVSVAAFGKNPATAPVRNVLSISSGVAYYSNRLSWIGFKGGSEPGVLTLTFLVDRTDGRTFVLSIGTNDGQAEADVEAIVALATTTIATLSTLSQDRGVASKTLGGWTGWVPFPCNLDIPFRVAPNYWGTMTWRAWWARVTSIGRFPMTSPSI